MSPQGARNIPRRRSVEPLNGLSREKGGEKRNLEMVNEGFHALLHRSAWRRDQFVVVDLDRTSWNLVQALTKPLQSPEKVTRHSNYDSPGR
jgi:hypothetical protein